MKATTAKRCKHCGGPIRKDAPFYERRAYCGAACSLAAADRRERVNREKRKK